MPVEVVVTITGSSVEDVHSQIRNLTPAPDLAAGGSASSAPPKSPAASSAVEPTPADPSTPPAESQQPPWAPSSS